MQGTAPPVPRDPREAARWSHTRLRMRLLSGAWASDLKARLRRSLGHVRSEAWGDPDLSSNVFASVCSQLAVAYDREPSVTHKDGLAAEMMFASLKAAGWSSQMQRVQRDTIGLREMLLRVDVVDGGIHLRPRESCLCGCGGEPGPARSALRGPGASATSPAGEHQPGVDVGRVVRRGR